MLILQWVATGVAVLVALAALVRGRTLSRRLERLSESYWELRYEHGQLQARLAQLEPPGAAGQSDPQPTRDGQTSFVPLSSLKR